MPYGRCVIYMFPGDAEEIIGKARTGILPIFKGQPGFVAYGVMVRGNHGHLSFSEQTARMLISSFRRGANSTTLPFLL